jgi:membrane protein required for colicin V production
VNALDWFFLGVLIYSIGNGFWRGFVYESISLASWVLAVIMAKRYGAELGAHLPMAQGTSWLQDSLGFVLTLVLTLFAGTLCGRMLKGIFSGLGLGPLDRLLGALFGIVRGLLMLLVVLVLLSWTPLVQQPAWLSSVGVYWLHRLLLTLQGIWHSLP